MKDLTEASLEELIKEIAALKSPITVRPTKLIIRPEIIQEIADSRNWTFEETLAAIQEYVRELHETLP